MLGMAFDFDHDILIVNLDFIEANCRDLWIFSLSMHWLKGHIGYKSDLMIAYKLLKGALSLFELEVSA